MSRYRVGPMYYLWRDEEYVVQKKHWYGWETIATYDAPHKQDAANRAIEHGKRLQRNGHEVEFYI